jgi:hypothetical protein
MRSIFGLLLTASFCSAHMEMLWPYPVRSQYDPAIAEAGKDYNLKSPLDANGDQFPCRGYQNDRPIQTKASYVTGGTYNMTIAGTVMHGGGSKFTLLLFLL